MRVITLTTLTLILSVTPALAQPLPDGTPRSHTSRVANIRHIAVSVFGPDICGDTLAVPIMRGPMINPGWVAYAHHESDTIPFTDCVIVVKDQQWDTERLCVVLQHEYGHLSGYRAPEGQQYIRPDGSADYDHSRDPRSLMWPFEISSYAPCENSAADTSTHLPSVPGRSRRVSGPSPPARGRPNPPRTPRKGLHMSRTKGISPKLAAAIGPPLTAIVSAAILTSTLDKQNAAALAGVIIGALLGYHAPAGRVIQFGQQPSGAGSTFATSTSNTVLDGMVGTMGPVTLDWRKGVPEDTDGDDQLPGELADAEPHHDPPPDEVDQPEQTQLKAGA